jgi:hypothetical protein
MPYNQQYGAYPGSVPPPPQQSSSGGFGKTCLGCGCAILVVLAIAIGIGCWMGYNYMQKNNTDLQELWDTWMYDSDTDYDAALNATYKGQPVSELAEEKGFPSVAYDERPQEVRIYTNRAKGRNIRFNYMYFKDGESIGVMTLTAQDGSEVKLYKMAPCGCSIYHLTNSQDASDEGFMFAYKRGERVLVNIDGSVDDFRLPTDDDDEEDEEKE